MDSLNKENSILEPLLMAPKFPRFEPYRQLNLEFGLSIIPKLTVLLSGHVLELLLFAARVM